MRLKIAPRLWFEIGAVLVALALVLVLGDLLVRSRNLALPGGQPVFGDYIAFWSAGRTVLDGKAEEVHKREPQWTHHREAVPEVKFYAQFASPPTLLLFTPIMALAPYHVSAIIFLALCLTLYFFAMAKILPDKRALIFAATVPAIVYQLGSIQLGMIVASVSGLALFWLDRRPRLAGALVSVLAIKPHLAILWPLLLALSGRWRAFAAAAIATAIFVAVGGLAFGFDAYLRFFASLSGAARVIIEQRVATPSYGSLYANLLQAHAPQAIAATAHAISAAGALGLSLWVFRNGQRGEQGAALCAATLLISPYMFFYDFALLAAGVALLGAPRNRFEIVAYVFGWGAGLSLAAGVYLPHPHVLHLGALTINTPVIPQLPIGPLAAWLVLIAALRRAGNVGPAPAPAPQT
jgi:hypothetical protein